MRILILTPTTLPSVTGNAVTAERWRQSLSARGENVEVVATETLSPEGLHAAIKDFAPDLVHAHHALRAGGLFLVCGGDGAWDSLPLVVSVAGTDLYLDSADVESTRLVEAVFRRAGAIVLQSREAENAVRAAFPELVAPVVRVPKAVAWLGGEPYDLRRLTGAGSDDVLFFQPAGIRPVKRNVECLLAMDEAHARCPQVRCIFAGPILDDEYGRCFFRELRQRRGFAAWVGLVPPAAMAAAFAGADVVVNTSESEGLSNALLEAMVAHKPILASDIPGNRWLVKGGGKPSGLLFDPDIPGDLARSAVRLAEDEPLRRQLAAAARDRAACWPTPEDEAEALVMAYRQCLDAKRFSSVE